MTTAQTSPVGSSPGEPGAHDRLRIEFLFLDLETCERCRGTDSNLESALGLVRETLLATGVEIEIDKVQVESAEQARKLRFESSPTIRVNGRDVALELRESSCGSEACTDGCGESIDCRVWVHREAEYTEPPVEMIVDAILREVYGGSVMERAPVMEPYELPANLARFFGVEPAAGAEVAEAEARTESACCSPAEQSSCCEPEDKAECCDASPGSTCGCR